MKCEKMRRRLNYKVNEFPEERGKIEPHLKLSNLRKGNILFRIHMILNVESQMKIQLDNFQTDSNV